MRQIIGSVWAGSVSAIICYAEYMGLGAMLGTALMGYGAQSQAMGTLLVVLAACVSCLVLSLRRLPLVAGPRGASLSILVLGLMAYQTAFPGSSADQLMLLVATMVGCVIMLFIGAAKHWVSWVFDRLPSWLVPAFLYASALSIVANASKQYISECLRVNGWQTGGIFLAGVVAGLLWLAGFKKIADRYKQSKPKIAGLARSFAGATLIVGAGVAWGLYEISQLPQAAAGMCARMGNLSLNFHMFMDRTHSLVAYEWGHLSAGSIAFAMFWGMMVACVVIIETRSAIVVVQKQLIDEVPNTAQPVHAPFMKWNACYQALLLPAATVASSISSTRSQMVWNLYKPSAVAVFMHAAALFVIAFYASHLLANLPQLALAVLMVLVACTMVSPQLEADWKDAYCPDTPSVRSGIGIWVVVGITMLSNMSLIGFVVPALWAICLHVKQSKRKQHAA